MIDRRKRTQKELSRIRRIAMVWHLMSLVSCLILITGIWALFSMRTAHGRDLGQWENSDPKVREWYQTLMQPDFPTASCCGEADAYWADELHVRDGKTFAKVTDDREDAPLKRPHIPVGTEFEIPNYKLKYSAGNPTGHNVLFVSSLGFVYCFVLGDGV